MDKAARRELRGFLAVTCSTLDAYDDASIGVANDVANGNFIGEDIGEALRACAPRLRSVHVSDTGHDVHRHAAVRLGSVDFLVRPDVLSEIELMRRARLEMVATDADAPSSAAPKGYIRSAFGTRRPKT